MFTLRHAFPGHGEEEPLFIFVRTHPLSFLPYAIICLIMDALAITMILGTLSIRSDLKPLEFNIALAASGIFALFVIVFSLIAFIDFYFDIQIVTDRRIIDVNQNRLFSRELAELNLEDVEDVSIQISGTMPTLFNYGDVIIQTAGERMNFHFQHVPRPREIASIISDLSEQVKRGVGPEGRRPRGPVKGVIGGQVVDNLTDLIRLGVRVPDVPEPSAPESYAPRR